MDDAEPYRFAKQHLLGIEGLNRFEIEDILDLADQLIANGPDTENLP